MDSILLCEALEPGGRPLLATLSRALEGVLREQPVREYIDAVVIQGHTDERGSAAFNRELSAKRANAVLNALFEANPTLEQEYGAHLAASVYSEFRPIDPAPTEAAYARNRRIEIAIVPKDSNVRDVIDGYLQKLDPAASRGGAVRHDP